MAMYLSTKIAFVLAFFSCVLPWCRVHSLRSDFEHDFSYVKLLQEATELPSEVEYDYIVVGGGTTSIPLATTLSTKYSVLVLERGSSPHLKPDTLHLSCLTKILQQSEEDDSPAQRFVSNDGVESARGRILGGGSSINFGIYSRAESEFYSATSIVGWDMNKVEEAYKWVEETVVSQVDLGPFQSIMFEALKESGLHPNNGFTLDHLVGRKVTGSTFDKSGRKHAAVELLNKANQHNLLVALHATVERVMFSTSSTSNTTATGVIFRDSLGKEHKASVRGNGEVILSAGTLGSPQLLLLSGIGPHSYLSTLGITVVHHQQDVGQFIMDPPRHNLGILSSFPLQHIENFQVIGITENFYIEPIFVTLPLKLTPTIHALLPTNNSNRPISYLHVLIIVGKLSKPLSRGTLRLASTTIVNVQPIVEFNYYTHPHDLANCIQGIKTIAKILDTNAMEKFTYQDLQGNRGFIFIEPSLPANLSDDAATESFCKKSVTTIWHYHGGCTLGKVVNGDFRVHGVSALRVLDMSVMPFSPGTNPQATLMMLGRYMGLKILQESDKIQKDEL